ncbi:alpha/beta hydrolase family protein [Aquimarina sediminis]|uniref:alpha/beta hydrolase family protein n=1 Tax=Aquimarina sediminis TaxID=2070536 RepID=UPI000CA05395|nr:prolyl oligopeptidase family serine peptidase [Aquimarina sediminis]
MFKRTTFFVLLLIIVGGLYIGSIIWCQHNINNQILTNTISETRIKFGEFEKTEVFKKKRLEGFSYSFLEASGILFTKLKPLKNTIHYSIAYKSDGLIVTGSMVTPKKDGKYPCIIFNRGGNRNYGRLDFRLINKYMTVLAEQGYIVIASNYRGNSGSEGKEEFGGKDVNDITNLISVLSKESMADTSKIGIYGHSRGGMMSYKSLQNSNMIKVAVVMAGTTNELTAVKDRPELEKNVHAQLIPDYYENKEKELKKRSVVFWTEELSKAPLLILHGTDDKRVNYSQAIQLSSKLDSLSFPYKMVTFKDDDHSLSQNRKEANSMIINWFNKYLRDEKPYNEVKKQMIIINKESP